MYLGCRVKIPRDGGNITVKKINGTSYVYVSGTVLYNNYRRKKE